MIPGHTKKSSQRGTESTLPKGVHDLYRRMVGAGLPVAVTDASSLTKDALNTILKQELATRPTHVLHTWPRYKGNGYNTTAYDWYSNLFNIASIPKMDNNYKAIKDSSNRARARYHRVKYTPGTDYLFQYNAAPGQPMPISTYTHNDSPQARHAISSHGRSFADIGKGVGFWGGYKDGKHTDITAFHEGVVPIMGHYATRGNNYGSTRHPDNFLFASARHGDAGNTMFKDILKKYGISTLTYGVNRPHSYYNSIPEFTGLMNRAKIHSAYTKYPVSYVNFNMNDPSRKVAPRRDGTYDLQDYIVQNGYASWNPKTNQFIPRFSITYKGDKPVLTFPGRTGGPYKIYWPGAAVDTSGVAPDKLSTMQQDAFNMLPPDEMAAIIQQLNRVYHLKGKQRDNSITPAEYRELKRVLELYPAYVEQARNNTKVHGYSYRPTAVA